MARVRTGSIGVPRSRRWSRTVFPICLAASGIGSAHGAVVARTVAPAGAVERVAINDNRAAAGSLRNGVLTLRLEARLGEWRPDGESDQSVTVRAFGEAGQPLQIPAPLIRVPRGTEIHAFVRNSLSDSSLVVHGLYARGAGGPDTVHVAPGQVREVRFTATRPGTFFYWASTSASATVGTRGMDSQLSGAFVVDSVALPGAARDRVIVLGLWSRGDVPGIIAPTSVVRFVMNGKTWPNTERLTYTVGDSVRFRIVNVSSAAHPMHLHGFYFKVDTRGSEHADTVYASSSPHHAVTERAAPGRTFSLSWVPERAGNWMFHCHDNYHVLRNRPLDGSSLPAEHHVADVKNHANEMMGGLVMGIEVRPKGPLPVVRDDGPRRKLRLVARVDTGGTDTDPAYGYALHDGAPARAAAPLLPGPTIVLTRGEPVSITVVNELREATAVHWHGIELESYFDGVAGFSGTAARLSPVVAPADSFEARFTPPRAGTFMYHPHADEVRQQQAGLSGAIVVLPPGERFDPDKDVVLMLSTPRRTADAAVIYLNGTTTPALREMRVGTRYRLRLVNIHTARPSMIARLTRDSTVLSWRAIAKDGMDLPPDQATVRPSVQQSGNGETFDFEFTPTSPGDLRFSVTSAVGVPLVAMPIRVR